MKQKSRKEAVVQLAALAAIAAAVVSAVDARQVSMSRDRVPAWVDENDEDPAAPKPTPLSEAAIAKSLAARFQSVMRSTKFHDKETLHRPVFGKSHGCVKADFVVNPELPKQLRIGVFAHKSFPAWIRFANDGGLGPDSRPAARGMAIKLVGVPGKKLLAGEERALTQDFIMQNHPVFFVDDALGFHEFIEAGFSKDPNAQKLFDANNPETVRILAAMDRNKLSDPLDGQYWSPLPSRLGPHAVKFMAKPCESEPAPGPKPTDGPNYLRENLKEHLKQRPACMSFYLQFQFDEESMPIDKAMVPWSEDKSRFVRFADLLIAQNQNVDAKRRDVLCENLSMNPWHSLPEHEPLGSISRVRRHVYKHMADVRRKKNGVRIAEPTKIHPED